MKTYNSPELKIINLQLEETILACESIDNGSTSCTTDYKED